MIRKVITTDPVLDEIHRIRRDISERFGGDLHAILADAHKRQAAGDRAVWSPARPVEAVPPGEGGDVPCDGQPAR